MEGIRICFPVPGSELVAGVVGDSEDDNECVKELFSLNLDMGPAGRARLVVCHRNKGSNICVKLSVTAEYLGVPLVLRVSQFILNADGSLHSKFDAMSSAVGCIAGKCLDTTLDMPMNNINRDQFTFIIMPTDIITDDGTCLVTSLHDVLDIDIQAAISSHNKYKESMTRQLETKELLENNKEEEEEIKIVQPLSAEEKKKKFPCGYCDFRAMTPVGLKKHLNKVHPYPD